MKNIIAQVLAGNTEAFAYIVNRYEARIYNLALRMLRHRADAQDATQEVFIKVFRQLAHYREEAQFSTWIYRIATNTCLDRIRKQKREQRQVGDGFVFPGSGGETPDCIVENRQLEEMLLEEIRALPDKYRVILLLYHQQGLSYKEIADVLNISVQAVGTRLHRAKALLKKRCKWLWSEEEAEPHDSVCMPGYAKKPDRLY
ncbi:RNA polymerase sigma factor [Lihuaxuella thermophila]|uniref:RNA polymerase sigma-70 factor, ECF subfamily n=1 Tax=Lihuaxuella thermophila TaxID=1173111 RepID=A0A1H8G687_9BACL|nr:sigma-70 family RNA polymerase sigma factor [Lihuaxuella thermophila]SEN38788.1 RNA polymerase sigma-70 factor, ECF subfamily [Lihuaxuella thermophila]